MNPLRTYRLSSLSSPCPDVPEHICFGGMPTAWMAVYGNPEEKWIWMWKVSALQLSPRITKAGKTVSSVSFNRKGDLIAVYHDDGTGAVYHTGTGRFSCLLQQTRSGWISIRPAGKRDFPRAHQIPDTGLRARKEFVAQKYHRK